MANEFVARKGIISIGNVGIGTTNTLNYASYVTLTIGDNSASKIGLLKFRSTYNTGNGAEIYQDTSGSLFFNVNSSVGAFYYTSTGATIFSSTVTATNFIGNWNGYTYSASSGANTMVQRDANGYIFNNYFNTSSGGAERNTSGMGYFTGFNVSDYYIRSYTAAAAATLLSGQTMNIVGSSTTATSATSLNSSNYISQKGSQGNWNSDFTSTPAGTLSYGGDLGANGLTGPGGSWWFQQNFRHTNSSNFWGTQVAWGWEDNQSRLATRNISSGVFGGWVYYLNGAGTISYIPKYTASGTLGNSRIFDNGSYIELSSSIVTIGQSPSRILINNSSNPNISITGVTCSVFGTLTCSGDVIAYYSSDENLKDNRNLITNAIDKIKQIGGYEFDWNDKQTTYHGHDIGVIAQEIEQVLPELVITRDNGYKAVKYEKIIALLIEGIKEQQVQIDKLKKYK
jgi:hypothetical protein